MSSIPEKKSQNSSLLILTGKSRQPTGYATISGPSGELAEADTATCAHCQFVIHIKPGSGIQRGWCRMCDEIVCGKKGCIERCTPFERKLEEWEGRRRLYQSFRQV